MGNVNKVLNSSQPVANYRTLSSVTMPSNEVDYEALLIGTSLYRRISTVRRFFCLFALFDFLFTFLIWIIYLRTQFSNLSYAEAFRLEILNYRVESSLFDIVSLAFFRFVIILSCYCLFILSHWWAIALTTSLTVVIITAKVFLFNWSSISPLIPVAILIFSFILSWGEAWFFDIKVVPSENRAAVLLAKFINQQIPRIPSSSISFNNEEEEFLSVAGSEDEEEIGDSSDSKDQCQVSLPHQLQEFKHIIDQSIEVGLGLLSSENWKMSKIQKQLIVQKMKLAPKHKLFKFVGVIPYSPNLVRECLFTKIENIPKWIHSMKQVLVVETVDSLTDIIHFESRMSIPTFFSPRDFVCIRSRQRRGLTYVQGTKSILYPDIVPSKGTLRGDLEHSLFVITPIDEDPGKCHLQWLLSLELKGLLPEYMCSAELEASMINTILRLQEYCKAILNTS